MGKKSTKKGGGSGVEEREKEGRSQLFRGIGYLSNFFSQIPS